MSKPFLTEYSYKNTAGTTVNEPAALKNSDGIHSVNYNALLQNAMPLLALMVAVRNTQECLFAKELNNRVIEQIKHFEQRSLLEGYSQKTVSSARYCLAIALDESVLFTIWGKNSSWSQHTLLNSLHNESSGGESFYIILEHLLNDSTSNVHMLELIYFILNLGYKGKYYNDDEALGILKENLFRTLVGCKPEIPPLAKGNAYLSETKKNLKPSFWTLMIVLGSFLLGCSFFIEKKSQKYENEIFGIINNLIIHKNIDEKNVINYKFGNINE